MSVIAPPASANPTASNGETVWGFGVPGASVQVTSASGEYSCTATVDALGVWKCGVSIPQCTVSLSATETLLGVLSLPLTLPIPKPFCTPANAVPKPGASPAPPTVPTPTALPSARTTIPPTQHVVTPPALAPVTPTQPSPPVPTQGVANPQAIAGPQSVLATWSTVGQPAGTAYTATAEPGGAHCTSTADHCLITGLKNGVAYQISVIAKAPDGAPSASIGVPTAVSPNADATQVKLSLAVDAGKRASGSASTIQGHGLMPGSTVAVVVHSTPRSLGSFPVGPDGTFQAVVHLPAGLNGGRHELIATGTGLNGAPASGRTGFSLTSAGTFAYTPYDPHDHPNETIITMGSAFALAMVAGGMGSLRRRIAPAKKASKTRSGKKPSVSMSHQEFRADAVEPGDRSRTWVSPFYTLLDRLGLTLPQRLNVISPMVARLVNDAAYLRAMLGTFALATPIAGLVLGAVAAANTDGLALPPSDSILFAIVLLGIVDALAGFTAAVAFSVGVLASGGLTDAASLRALIALDVVFFAAILVVSATRELRREPAANAAECYDRAADFAVGTVLAVWAVKATVGALPALTGLNLPVTHSLNRLLWLVAIVTVARFAAETLAAHWYPERLLLVAPEAINPPPNWRTWLAIATKLLLFLFFAYSYMGNHWQLWACAGLMFISLAMPKWKARFPNWSFLAKIIPGGIIGLLFYFLLGAYSLVALKHAVSDPKQVTQLGWVLLMIPSIVCAAIALTARNGDGWKLTWLWRLTGIPMLVLVVLIVGGTISVT